MYQIEGFMCGNLFILIGVNYIKKGLIFVTKTSLE